MPPRPRRGGGRGRESPRSHRVRAAAGAATRVARRPWDNIRGFETDALHAGGVYHVDSGAGCVHHEPFDPISSGETFGARFDARGGPTPAEGDETWLAQLRDAARRSKTSRAASFRAQRSAVIKDESRCVSSCSAVGFHAGGTTPCPMTTRRRDRPRRRSRRRTAFLSLATALSPYASSADRTKGKRGRWLRRCLSLSCTGV